MRLPQVDSESQHFLVDEALFSHKHVFSHKIWELSVVKSRIITDANLPSYWKWIPLAEVDSQPWISAHRKILVKFLKKSDLTSL
jgi:adenine-specific DNA glycosylase